MSLEASYLASSPDHGIPGKFSENQNQLQKCFHFPALRLLSISLIFILFILKIHYTYAQPQDSSNCSILPKVSLNTNLMQLQVQGLGLSFSPLMPNGDPSSEASAYASLLGISQWYLADVGESDFIVSELFFNACSCSNFTIKDDYVINHLISTGTPLLSVEVTPTDAMQTVVQFWISECPSGYENFTGLVQFSIASQDFNITYLNTEHTHGVPLVYSYKAGAAKFSIFFREWPWAPDMPTNRSYLALTIELTMNIVNPLYLVELRGDFVITFDVVSQNTQTTLMFQRGAVLDGVPYRDDWESSANPNTTQDLSGIVQFVQTWTSYARFFFDNTSRFDPPSSKLAEIVAPRYYNLSYDPMFISIFTGSGDSPISDFSNPNSPTSKAIRESTIIIIAVIIPVCVILAFLSIVLIKFKHLVRPFTKRVNDQASSKHSTEMDDLGRKHNSYDEFQSSNSSHNSDPRWSAAVKPVHY